MVEWNIEIERIWFGMEHEGTKLPAQDQTSIDKALLIELQRAFDAQSSAFDTLDGKASVLLSTAGIIATILLALLGWWFSDSSIQLGICPLAFIPGISLFVAAVGVAIWALWARAFSGPIWVSAQGIQEYRSSERDDLIPQLLSQYIAAYQRNQDRVQDKVTKVRQASIILFVGVLYFGLLAIYALVTS